MNKKYIIPMLAILLIGTVFASSLAINHIFDIKDVTSFEKVSNKKPSNQQILKLTINGTEVEVNGTEPDGKYDDNDIASLISRYSVNGTITKVELVGVGTWKENKYGDKSFNEEVLKCLTYDSKLNDCLNVIEDVEGKGDEAKTELNKLLNEGLIARK